MKKRITKILQSSVINIVISTLFMFALFQQILLMLSRGNYFGAYFGGLAMAMFIFVLLNQRLVGKYRKLTDEFNELADRLLKGVEIRQRMLKKEVKKSEARLATIQGLNAKITVLELNQKPVRKNARTTKSK